MDVLGGGVGVVPLGIQQHSANTAYRRLGIPSAINHTTNRAGGGDINIVCGLGR